MFLRSILALGLIVVVALTACGQGAASAGQAAGSNSAHSQGEHQAQQPAGSGLLPVLATSELVVGPNRVALGLIENNVPIKDAPQTRVMVRYYKLEGDQGTLVGEEEARFYGEGLGARGTFIVHPTFDTAGQWGIEVEAQRPGKPATTERIAVEVLGEGKAVTVGAAAPRSKTPTAAETEDLRTISSDAEPDPRLHQLSVDQAVTSGKPSMILFATPGFCKTAVCGPGVDVLGRLQDEFGDKVNAIHVEVYRYPFEPLEQVKAMGEWGLQTEPWLFLVDKDGRIAARFEGGITYPEIQPEVAKLVQ